jgi:hypothetical protein
MLYILAIVAALSFASGYGVSHQIDKAEVQKMSNDIAAANVLADTTLREKTQEVEVAKAKTIKSNSDLDASHEAFIKTAVAYDQQLDSVRLYARSRAGCVSPTATSNPTGVPKDPPGEAELDAEIDRTIKEAASVADVAADYADKAYQFTTINNCGIAKDAK